MYFHTDNMSTIQWLSNVTARAASEHRRLRFDVDENGDLRVKLGEGVWSAPIASTDDPHRDNR